ncbi:MAG: hypothetical protein ONB44_22135 [candidate division KSB1 bacterium]|nr:hypothetical protein [candidate division KSB1 bacterium]MDZ7304836.1 hypothetical protein [candidate division KSB1 bacterium]MDZ7313916.1 hypothetical protein [candidate division KSB1 bacterium]
MLFAFSLFAQESPVSVESRIDKSTITIGDTVRYTVRLTRDEKTQVRWPALGANLGMFEIRDYNKPEPRKSKGRIIEEIAYTISTFDTGRFEIPPIVVDYQVPPDTAWHSLQTEKLEIYVASMRPSQAGDIRDIKMPWELPRDWKLIIRIALIVFGILLLAAIGFYLWRRRKGKGLLPVRKEPERPAHEVALEALRKLRESDLLATGKIKQFYVELSEIVRRYIEGRYLVPALELTTSELMENLQQAGLAPDSREMLSELLEISDLVKFAKYEPSVEEHERAMQLAESFIEATKLVIVAPAETGTEKAAATSSTNAEPITNLTEVS